MTMHGGGPDYGEDQGEYDQSGDQYGYDEDDGKYDYDEEGGEGEYQSRETILAQIDIHIDNYEQQMWDQSCKKNISSPIPNQRCNHLSHFLLMIY